MSARQPAPASLRLVEEFVNTLEEDVEELRTPADLARWCAAHGIAGSEIEVDDAAVERATGVREALRALLFANNGHPLDTNAIRTLNDFAATVPHRLRFDAHGSKLEAAGDTVDAALARILLAAHAAMADGTWYRLKACRAPTWRSICVRSLGPRHRSCNAVTFPLVRRSATTPPGPRPPIPRWRSSTWAMPMAIAVPCLG